MGISKYNSEGYYDLTAKNAISNAIKAAKHSQDHSHRTMVFICSPYAGDVERNIQSACKYARFAVRKGRLPIAPHLLFPQFMTDSNESERSLAIAMGLTLMNRCQTVWAFGNKISS